MNNDIYMNGGQTASIQMVADFDGDINSLFSICKDGEMPIIPTRNIVLHPGVLIPIMVTRDSTLSLINQLKKHPEKTFAVVCQRDSSIDEPDVNDLYEYGVVGKFVKIFELPGMGNNLSVVVQGLSRCKLESVTKTKPYLKGIVKIDNEIMPEKDDQEFSMALADLRQRAVEYVQNNDDMPNEAQFAVNNISHDILAVNFMCTNMPFPIEDKARLLAVNDMKTRVFELLSILSRELQYLELKNDIRHRTQQTIDEEQKEYFLRQQMKSIRKELGGDLQNMERSKLTKKAKEKKWNKETRETFDKELLKLDMLQPQSPDYNVQLTFLNQILDLPWGEYSDDNLNIERAAKKLDSDHYGMEKVKERILEYISVLNLRGDLQSPIMCLYGPPGVGKTSLGKSIAEALNRKYVRVSLGGLHDESEIRGHRRTYIGAMPGRIIKGIQKAGTSNPVFVLDEVDKVTQHTNNGDPSSALLEVLDPEQNSTFHDNFLDINYDLSHVLFIATANSLDSIPRPLLDRMELIEMTGYLQEEKEEIAKRHLIPNELAKHGIKPAQLKFRKDIIGHIIDDYTRESGVRSLDRKIAAICRKIDTKLALEQEYNTTITREDLIEYLGQPRYSRDSWETNKYIGVVTGLAWTQVGGEILFIEASLSPSKTPTLTLTGNLGDVMKESATLALGYIKAHAQEFGIKQKDLETKSVHIHVPEGAIPKDGPSAGITMTTALVSAFTKRKVRPRIAMTGEMTLRGKVLPIGGVKEKILAAKRAGITDLILCADNRKDVSEIPEIYLKGLTFHYVQDIQEVIDFALVNRKS